MDKSQTRITEIDKDLIQGLTQKEVEVELPDSGAKRAKLLIVLSKSKDFEKEQTRSRILIKENDDAREHLQVVIQESSQKTLHRAQETKDYQDNLGRENNSLRSKIDSQEQTIRDRENTIHEREHTITSKERNITEINLKLQDLSEMKTLNERLNKQINDSESRRVDLQREFD